MTAFGIYGKEVPVGKKNIQNMFTFGWKIQNLSKFQYLWFPMHQGLLHIEFFIADITMEAI